MGINQTYALISNGTATGAAFKVNGGLYAFSVQGTFSGATVKLQILGPDGATYQDIDAALALTAAGIQGVDLPGGATVKAVVSGGPPSGIYANLAFIR